MHTFDLECVKVEFQYYCSEESIHSLRRGLTDREVKVHIEMRSSNTDLKYWEDNNPYGV